MLMLPNQIVGVVPAHPLAVQPLSTLIGRKKEQNTFGNVELSIFCNKYLLYEEQELLQKQMSTKFEIKEPLPSAHDDPIEQNVLWQPHIRWATVTHTTIKSLFFSPDMLVCRASDIYMPKIDPIIHCVPHSSEMRQQSFRAILVSTKWTSSFSMSNTLAGLHIIILICMMSTRRWQVNLWKFETTSNNNNIKSIL